MENIKLEIRTAIQILKPADEIFEAIIEPSKMSNYFISESTGRMETDKKIVWRFLEFDMDVPIRVGKIEKDKYISYYWMMDEKEQIIEITLTPYNEKSTVVVVTEKGRENNESGIKWLKENTEGWANFLACLKAYLEYGINLRKGGFEFLGDKSNNNI